MLCQEVISTSAYREQLNTYLSTRVLAAKTALSARVDSFAETEVHPAAEYREKLPERLSASTMAPRTGAPARLAASTLSITGTRP